MATDKEDLDVWKESPVDVESNDDVSSHSTTDTTREQESVSRHDELDQSNEQDDDDSSHSTTDAMSHGKQGHDELDEILSSDVDSDDNSSHSNTDLGKQEPECSHDEVDESDVQDDEDDDDEDDDDDEVDESNVQVDDEVDESNVQDDDDGDDEEDDQDEEDQDEGDQDEEDLVEEDLVKVDQDEGDQDEEDLVEEDLVKVDQDEVDQDEEEQDKEDLVKVDLVKVDQDEEEQDEEEQDEEDQDEEDPVEVDQDEEDLVEEDLDEEDLVEEDQEEEDQEEEDQDEEDLDEEDQDEEDMVEEDQDEEDQVVATRKRGRPRKREPPTLEDDHSPRQQGRPRKREPPTLDDDHSPRPRKMPKETTRSPVASLNTEQEEEPRREPGTEIGSSVYAQWENGLYYWAVITDIKRKTCSHYDQYSLQFYDGDVLEYASRRFFDTEEEYRMLCGKKPPPMPDKIRQMVKDIKKPVAQQACSPRELYSRRCTHCELCRKPDCGECSTCMENKQATQWSRQVCLQNMCINIPIPTKEQPAVGLPDGWTFVFQEDKSSSKNAYIPGLWIFWNKKSFRSVEAASALVPTVLEENPRAVRDFYRHVGINLSRVSGSLQSQQPSSVAASVSHAVSLPMTLEALLKNKCGECVNCTKDDCGRCASCMNNKQATRNRQVCLQKMCVKISVSRKMQPAVGLPAGWTFVFQEDKPYSNPSNPNKYIPGLWLFRPMKKKAFRSVEAAMTKLPKSFEKTPRAVHDFYKHVGINPAGVSGSLKSQKPSVVTSGCHAASWPMTLEELLDNKCGECVNCQKDDCGRCASCVSNHRTQVCIQKICCEVSVERKAQPMPPGARFPDGWTFIIDPTMIWYQTHKAPMKGAEGLKILPPTGSYCYYSVEGAIARQPKGLKGVCPASFYAHIGVVATDATRSLISGSSVSRFDASDTDTAPHKRCGFKAISSSMTLEELLENKCGKCVNCTKDDCGRCASCVSNPWTQVCIQKMCCEVSLERKAQPMPPGARFPNGWTFIIDPTMEGYDSISAPMKGAEGLKILPPTGLLRFNSVEGARARHPKGLEGVCPGSFYAHIGVVATDASRSLRLGSSVSRFDVRNEDVSPHRRCGSKSVSSSMTLTELLKKKCGKCMNCQKDDCGRCASCVSNHRSQVCIQKICCKLSLEQKAQPMPPGARFPNGWTFIIDPTMKGYQPHRAPMKGAKGLKILPPTGSCCYYSVEGAKARHAKGLKDVCPGSFYSHIGVVTTDESRSLISGSSVSRSAVSDEDVSPHGRCGVCENCMKDACGRCARCRLYDHRHSRNCFQKMCFAMSVDAKAEPAVGFPLGWRFCFTEWRPPMGKKGSCLLIISPGGRFYRSVEAAVGSNMVGSEFYEHVGLQEGKRTLSNYRVVGARVYCAARNGIWSWGNIVEKYELGHNRFRYSVRLEDDNSLLQIVDEKRLQSEVCYKNKSGMEPPLPPNRREIGLNGDEEWIEGGPHKQQKTDESPREIKTTTDHFLIGRKFYLAWTDLKGQNKMVYGEVTECEKNVRNGKAIRFKVTYSSKSRGLMDAIGNGCGLVLPEWQMLPPALAVGGCVLFEREMRVASGRPLFTSNFLLPFYWSWITPIRRHEELVDIGGSKCLPRLTLLLQGFRLVLNVKLSTIPNAGYGVFLSCTSLMDDGEAEYFELKAGDLIDLGIYGPFQIEDQKLEAVFFVKNFVHSHKCDAWSFDAGDKRYQLDITDDYTGDLHTTAMSHVLAYVNESDVDHCITIKAEHDPEGSVHYLLGHANQSQGSFAVPTDGSEFELFVNYGSDYENVRIRKGYSFVSQEERARIMEHLSHEDADDLREMDRFGEKEIEACVKFFLVLFSTEAESQFTPEMIERALLCFVVLLRRVQHKFVEQVQRAQHDDGSGTTEASTIDLKGLLKESRVLVSLLLGMVRDEQDILKMLHRAGKFDELLRKVFERHFSGEELRELGEMIHNTIGQHIRGPRIQW